VANGALRSADELLAPVVEESIAALTLSPEDAAAVRLVRRYAAAIDEAGTAAALESFGPKLLAALNALGATPAARTRLRDGIGGAPGVASSLAALRAARRSG
jgi:hypothetical protein